MKILKKISLRPSYSFLIPLFTWGLAISVAIGQNNFINFDGTDDHVVVSPGPSYDNNSLTFEAWIRTTGTDESENIVTYSHPTIYNSVEFRVSYGKIQFGIWDGSVWQPLSSNSSVNTGNWVHVAVVKNGTSVELYINDNLDQTGTITSVPTVSTLTLGNGYFFDDLPWFGSHGFPGEIDEVRIWSTKRTQTQIQENRNRELVGDESGLLAYYNFNSGDCGQNNSGLAITNIANPGTYDVSPINMDLNLMIDNSGCTSNLVCAESCSYTELSLNPAFSPELPAMNQLALLLFGLIILSFSCLVLAYHR